MTDLYDTPYLTGIECPYCKVKPDERCVTAGGNPYTEPCHAGRRQAAKKAGVKLTLHARTPLQKANMENMEKLKLALWYLRKMGNESDARLYLERALEALRG